MEAARLAQEELERIELENSHEPAEDESASSPNAAVDKAASGQRTDLTNDDADTSGTSQESMSTNRTMKRRAWVC